MPPLAAAPGTNATAARAQSVLATGVLAGGMFGFLVSIPVVSPLLMAALGCLAAPMLAALRSGPRGFLFRLLLLTAAAVAYYTPAAWHGFLLAPDAAAFAVVAVASYVVAQLLVAADRTRRALAITVLLSGVLGAVLFASVCVAGGVKTDLGKRYAFSIWNGEIVAATVLGAMAALGLGLGALLFFGGGATPRLVRAVALLGTGLGLYANLALSNRTPLLAAAAVLLAGGLLHLRARGVALWSRLGRLALVAAALVAGAVLLPMTGWVQSLDVLERFRSEGLESARYELWSTAVTHLFDSWFGGRIIKIPENYMHNLWLDAMWDAGLPALGLLLAFHLAHARPVVRYFASDEPLWARQTLLGLGVAIAFTSMSEPVLAFRNPYFAFSCAYLGVVAAMWEHRAAPARAGRVTPSGRLRAGSDTAAPG